MKDGKASRTAEYMALFRAVETAQPAGVRLFEDRYAAGFLAEPLRTVASIATWPVLGRAVTAVLDLGWPRTRSSGVVRTRFIDDAVRGALAQGAKQLVLLGAGFDSRPYRLAEADAVTVFEVDHPATQAVKRARLAQRGGAAARQAHFVAVDFERDDFEDALLRSGYKPGAAAVVIWEGVVSYLSSAAVDENFTRLQRLTAPGRRLVFTYVHRGAIDGSVHFDEATRWKSWVRFSGEPFTFGFDPREIGRYLRSYGFALSRDVSTAEIATEYGAANGRHERGSDLYRVAVAERV
jgi:methyltransferase (TIGR00027 family)